MTRDHDVKRAIRARMRATGETYMVARTAFVAPSEPSGGPETSESQGGTMSSITSVLENLDRNGFALVQGFASPTQVADLAGLVDAEISVLAAEALVEARRRLEAGEGGGTGRAASLALLSDRPEAAWLLSDQRLRDITTAAKGSGHPLEKIAAIVSRPGTGHQGLHQDSPGVDGPLGTWEKLVFVLMLTENRPGAGAIRALPGSHRSAAQPFPNQVGSAYAPCDGEVHIEAEAGDLLVYSGNLWKSGTHNGGRETTTSVLIAGASDVGWG